MFFIYWILQKLAKAISSVYFKKVNVVGLENIPMDGPLIICGNHANQFIDPIMIVSHLKRQLSFTIAASSFSKPIVGDLARAVKAIPVKRPEDSKVKGSGKIVISGSKVSGKGTNFTEQDSKIDKGWSILVGAKTVVVKNVIDNENLDVSANDETKEISNKEVDFYYIPKLDNSVLFKEAYNVLNRDGCICIFPEGTSHDRPDFIKLKAGIAFMALGAMAEHNCKNVKIVSVGLNYFNREKFRSDVNIEFGKPFEIPLQWAEEFKTNKRDVTEKLLKEVESRMKAVTLFAPSIEELTAVMLFRKVYVPKDLKLSPTQINELNKRFIKGYNVLKDEAEMKEVIKEGVAYVKEIDELGLDDRDVLNSNFQQTKMKRKFLLSVLLFFTFCTFMTPGLLIVGPFIFYIMNVAEKERIAAKAKNANKIEALDIVSSVKVFKFLSIMPFVYIIWILCFFWFSGRYECLNFSIINKFILASIIFPVYFYLSCLFIDYISFCMRTVYSRTVFFLFPAKLKKLKDQRDKLGVRIRTHVDKYIGLVDKDYEPNRIVPNKETPSNTPVEDKSSKKLSEDSIEYLERRAVSRKTKKSLVSELNMLSQLQTSFKPNDEKNTAIAEDSESDIEGTRIITEVLKTEENERRSSFGGDRSDVKEKGSNQKKDD